MKGRGADQTGRSKPDKKYVGLGRWLLRSPAWLSLDPVARAAYVELKFLYHGTNNGKLAWSVRDAASNLLVSPATVMRALKRLEDHGFIRRMKQGSFRRHERHAAEWRLTEHTCDVTGQLASREFATWVPQVHVVKPERQNSGARGDAICARSETPGARDET